jgi:hypothetical protein
MRIVFAKTKIPACNNSNQFPVIAQNRGAGKLVSAQLHFDIANQIFFPYANRILDNPVQITLYIAYLPGLLFRTQVPVDYAGASLKGQSDGELFLGYGIHRRGNDGNV